MALSDRSDLHQAIVRAAIELGSELGEEGLTMRAIASRLGLSPTALYHHFESKAQIIDEIRLHGLQTLGAACMHALAHADLREALVDASRAYVRFARENPWLYRVLMHSEVDPRRLFGEEASVRNDRASDDVRRGVIDRFRELVPDVDDPEGLSRFLGRWWAANHGIASLVIGGRIAADHPILPIDDIDGFIDEALRGFVDGVLHRANLQSG